MSQINDAINAAIADVGTANSINDKLLRYYQANGATSLDLDDAEREFLLAHGAGPTLGPEIITDPPFTNTVFWTEGPGWTVAIPTPGARIDGVPKPPSTIGNVLAWSPNGRYLVEVVTSEYVQGVLQFGLGAFRSVFIPRGNGVHQRFVNIPSGPSGPPLLEADGNALLTVNSFSIKEVTGGNIHLHIQDMWDYYLRVIKGYTGALDDMLYQYWTVGPRP